MAPHLLPASRWVLAVMVFRHYEPDISIRPADLTPASTGSLCSSFEPPSPLRWGWPCQGHSDTWCGSSASKDTLQLIAFAIRTPYPAFRGVNQFLFFPHRPSRLSLLICAVISSWLFILDSLLFLGVEAWARSSQGPSKSSELHVRRPRLITVRLGVFSFRSQGGKKGTFSANISIYEAIHQPQTYCWPNWGLSGEGGITGVNSVHLDLTTANTITQVGGVSCYLQGRVVSTCRCTKVLPTKSYKSQLFNLTVSFMLIWLSVQDRSVELCKSGNKHFFSTWWMVLKTPAVSWGQ